MYSLLFIVQGTAVAQWLRCCATNRKVAGSIPDGVIGIFHWHNPSDHTMALGSTQPVTEMSTRKISWGRGGRCVRLTTLPPSCAVVMKSGNLNFVEPSGPLQACNGTALLITVHSSGYGPCQEYDIYACVQDFVVHYKFLVSILSAFTQWTNYTILKMLDVFSLGVVQQSPAPSNSTAVLSLQPVVPCALPDISCPHGNNFVIYEMYCILNFIYVSDLSLHFVSAYYLQTSYLLLVDMLTACLSCSILCFLYLNKCNILHLAMLFL